ncbi:MAG: hypothetical protein GXX85_16360 [Ignavibacteria bacterium]|nr:hypothetical protein [Ignavibacteria bacterium]
MKKIGLTIVLISILLNVFANESNDTIRVVIDLKQVDSLGLKIQVYPPSDLFGKIEYKFPKSIPGIYEYLNSHKSLITLKQNNVEINCVENSFLIDADIKNNVIAYSSESSVKKMNNISAEDTYFLKDSIYILNWHYLLGFFKNETKRPYKIEITKKSKLFGTGSLAKNTINDTLDIFYATDYKNLIHSPLMYNVPDTTMFRIGETNFAISCVGNDTLLNSNKIRDLIYKPLAEIYSKSLFKHKEYSFLYFSDYSLLTPYLTGLEHPNSTLICYHSALLNNNILISSSIHEYIHAIYAPLRIRSEMINGFNFINPKCDEFLWFYEGVTEYLSIKTLVKSGFFEPEDFFNELDESNKYHKNINFNKLSSNIYGNRGQKQFDNFYTKGSLFALHLDLEILNRSHGNTDLFDVMQKLQELYSPDKPFNTKTFIDDFSSASGVDINEYIYQNTQKKKKIDYIGLLANMGYEKKLKDSLIWSFKPSKIHTVLNFKKDRLELAFFGSIINEVCNSRKVSVYEINGESLTWYNYDKLIVPTNDDEILLKARVNDEEIEFSVKPEQILRKKKFVYWKKNENNKTILAINYWK